MECFKDGVRLIYRDGMKQCYRRWVEKRPGYVSDVHFGLHIELMAELIALMVCGSNAAGIFNSILHV